MKVYLAAPYEKKEIVKELVKRLREDEEIDDTDIVSTWHDQPDGIPRKEWGIYAKKDLEEIRNSDMLICISKYCSQTGGMHFETGYAYALGIPVYYLNGTIDDIHIFQLLVKTPSKTDIDFVTLSPKMLLILRELDSSEILGKLTYTYTEKALDAITSILESRKPEGNEFEVFDNCSVGHSELVMNQIALKLARIKCNKSVQDSLLDIAGYALLEYAMNERDIDAGKFPS